MKVQLRVLLYFLQDQCARVSRSDNQCTLHFFSGFNRILPVQIIHDSDRETNAADCDHGEDPVDDQNQSGKSEEDVG